jgi:hypothetical protein
MLGKIAAILAVGACVINPPLRGQRKGNPFVRLEAGSLNPKVLLETTLAVGASTGWQLGGRDALLLRYLRQSQNRAGTDVGRHARSFLTMNWEHAFGVGGLFRRQAMVRVGGGAVFRYLLRTAPVVDAGLEVRYGLARHWSLVANIEDDAASLPRQVIQVCSFGSCSVVTFPHDVEHNFGLIVAGEWRP